MGYVTAFGSLNYGEDWKNLVISMATYFKTLFYYAM